jgi:hypothetical protein
MLGVSISPEASAVIAQCINILIVIVLVSGKWFKKIEKKYLKKTTEESHAQSMRIYILCAEAGVELDAIRVYVSKYKNGHFYYSGEPDDRKDRAIEWIRPHAGIEPVADRYADVLVSTVLDEMALVLVHEPTFIAVADLPEGTFKYYCVRDGSAAIARIGIYQTIEGKSQLVSMLGVDFDTTDKPKNLDVLVKYAGLISIESNFYLRPTHAQ